MKKVLTIGGSDPSGWAGVQADILTFSRFGLRGFSAITAITAQTEKGVKYVRPLDREIVRSQVETLLKEHRIDAVKIGMVASAGIADTVGKTIKKWELKNIVLDPVMSSTGGKPLIEKNGIAALKRLLRLVTVVTPNIDEAETLSKIKVKTVEDMKEAARKIRLSGPKYVLIKGGHLKGAPVDILYDGKNFSCFKGHRIKGEAERFHGTGCLLSSAIAAGLAKGEGVEEALREARRHVKETVEKRAG